MKEVSKIILINKKSEILLYLRDNNPLIVYHGWWDIFGGEIEEGETDLDAIKREVREEIGIKVNSLRRLGEVIYEKRYKLDYDCKISVFTGRINNQLGKIKLNEGQKLGFFKLADLHKIKFPDIWRNFILKNKKKIFNH